MISVPISMMRIEVAPTPQGKPIIVFVRADRANEDIAVIQEVIINDCYRHAELAKGFTPEVILDVGGHIGSFGLLAKNYWPQPRLIAFEPNPISHFLYRMNMSENGCTNYEVVNKAVSYDSQASVLLEIANGTGCGFLQPKEQANKCKTKGLVILRKNIKYKLAPTDFVISNSKVEKVTIEQLFDEYEISKVDLAKWDCEGSEIGIFQNMSDESVSKFNYMAGEYHLPNKEGNHLNGTIWELAEFTIMLGRKFPHLEIKVTPNYPTGCFWSRPKDGENWVMKTEGLVDLEEVTKGLREAIELSASNDNKRFNKLFRE